LQSRSEIVYLASSFYQSAVVNLLLREVDVLASDVNRNYVPGHKNGGSVSFYALLNQAPAILSLPVHLFQVGGARTGSVSDYDARH
jgi:hypothetical protein